ncbi:hypothetical protein GS891_12015 [Rhodococcus hoagii]|nr:hypothetical protein [Prescottella equi]
MSAEKQSFMRWWGRRMLIVLPPWVPAFILMAMGAGVWAYVVGIGGNASPWGNRDRPRLQEASPRDAS